MTDRDGVKVVAGIDERMKSMNLDDIYDAVIEGDAPGADLANFAEQLASLRVLEEGLCST